MNQFTETDEQVKARWERWKKYGYGHFPTAEEQEKERLQREIEQEARRVAEWLGDIVEYYQCPPVEDLEAIILEIEAERRLTDPRTPKERELDEWGAEWRETYDDLRAGLH